MIWRPTAVNWSPAIAAEGAEGFYAHADVSGFSQVETMVAAVIRKFGPIDILINNAGITRDATLLKMTEEQWNQVIGVNLTGVFHCTRAVAPQMVERGHGKIINTSSIVGTSGNFGQTNYAAAKAGLIGMTKTWARELGPKGITVNAVAPGFIATEMVKKMPEKVLQGMRGTHAGSPAGRTARRGQRLFVPRVRRKPTSSTAPYSPWMEV